MHWRKSVHVFCIDSFSNRYQTFQPLSAGVLKATQCTVSVRTQYTSSCYARNICHAPQVVNLAIQIV
ncbi:hypothetical protein SAMN04489800_2623 [Pseudomonas deceptionensis]|uniref:Uncharacterized protein n=1 Tax=Pseudomonas deceptionensis TaxID=882211 RepID=A0A1H5MFX1_PSEDM|nr:hypothetical protein SAMN04489800_2623 [Pseudomonas deceptionensis]